jgi:hypothetical protein
MDRFRGIAVAVEALFGIAWGWSLSGCLSTSDDEYVKYVNERLAKGPAEACCVMGAGDPNPARTAACRREADVKCGFVRGARVTKLKKISRFGEDTGASVDVEIAGPNGRGFCHYQVYRSGRMEYGGCLPEGAIPP